jgi:hypothetical protein
MSMNGWSLPDSGYFAWDVDYTERSVGGIACLSTLGLLEFVSLCVSCAVTPKSFAAGWRLSNILAVGAGDKSLAARRSHSTSMSNSSGEV